MRAENQEIRKQQIFEAAYSVLETKGYRGTSMLDIAKEAAASNQTLYKWFGNKQGLLSAMVMDNARTARELLEKAIEEESDPRQTLDKFGPVLLRLLTSERAIALNRAAAADVSNGGDLGRTLAAEGREAVLPLIQQVFSRAIEQDKLRSRDAELATETYLSLLIGDIQIRRVIGVTQTPTDDEINSRAVRATQSTFALLGTAAQSHPRTTTPS